MTVSQELEQLAPDSRELSQIKEQVRLIQGTEFVPTAYRGKPHAILACILTGRGLGIDPMHALRSIHVIDGRPTLSAELMVALARERGHSITGDFGAEQVTVNGKRGDNGDTMTVTWTFEMAKRASLVGKNNWKNYPEAMLWARAVSQLCRMLFPDVVKGVSYTEDEAELDPHDKIESIASDLPLPPDEGVETVEADFAETTEAEQEPMFEAPKTKSGAKKS